jgi:hypothetical protein
MKSTLKNLISWLAFGKYCVVLQTYVVQKIGGRFMKIFFCAYNFSQTF